MSDWKIYGKSLSSYSDKEAIEWLQGCVENLEAENKRLRALVKKAYKEGHEDAGSAYYVVDSVWKTSESKKALGNKR